MREENSGAEEQIGPDAITSASAADMLALARSGSWQAARVLARVLAGEQPIPIAWQPLARGLTAELATVLADRGEQFGAKATAGVRFRNSYGSLPEVLAEVLLERGDAAHLHARTQTGDSCAGFRLDDLLMRNRDVAGLQARVAAGSLSAVGYLTGILYELDDADALRTLLSSTPDGTHIVRETLARLLYDRRDLRELRTLYQSRETSEYLIRLLSELGEVRELRRRARRFEPLAGPALAQLLLDRGDVYGASRALEHAAGGEATNVEERRMLEEAWSLGKGLGIPVFAAWVVIYVLPTTVIFAWVCGFQSGGAIALGLVSGGLISLAVLAWRGWTLPGPLT